MIRRTAKIALEAIAVLTAGFVLAVGFAAWRLSDGPVSVPFLSPYLERALSPRDGSFSVSIDDTVLTWAGWERAIEIRAIGMKATRKEGGLIAEVPAMTVNLSARALFEGMIAPTALAVIAPHITVQRSEAGRFSMGMARSEIGTGEFLSNLFSGLLADADSGSLSYLNSVEIVEASFLVADAHLGFSWQVPRTNALLERDSTGIRGRVTADIQIESKRIRVSGAGIYSRSHEAIELGLKFSGLEPGLFARPGQSDEILELLGAIQLPLDGIVSARLRGTGHLEEVSFAVNGRAGTLVVPRPEKQMYEISSFKLRGHANENLDQLTIDEFNIATNGPRLSGSAQLSNVRVRPKLELNLSVSNVAMDTLKDYWPDDAGVNARRWVLANISDGFVHHMEATVTAESQSGGGLQADLDVASVRGVMVYDGLTVNYMSPLPPAKKVRGSATFTQNQFDFKVEAGDFAGLAVERATITIGGLMDTEQRANIQGVLKGPLRDALAIVDSEPFRYAQKLGVSPSQIAGAATVNLEFEFPLIDDLKLEHVDLRATASLQNVAWQKALLGLDVTGGNLALEVGKSEMKLEGRVDLAGAPAQVSWVEMFGSSPKFRRQFNVKGSFDKAVQAAVGLDFGSILSGPVDATVVVTEADSGRSTVKGTFDLTKSDVDVSFLGARKRPGSRGSAEVTLDMVGGRLTAINRFRVDAEGFTASGSARLRANGTIEDVHVEQLRSGLTDITVAGQERQDGSFHISLKGRSVDATQLTSRDESVPNAENETAGLGPLPTITIDAEVDRVHFAPDRYISRAVGQAEYRANSWRRLALDGLVGEDKSLRLRLQPHDSGQALSITSDDAGATLRALNLFDTIVGGKLAISGTILGNPATAPLTGLATIDNFRVIKAPVMARIMSLASLTGISDVLSGEAGVAFTKMAMPFSYRDHVIEVKDGQAYGSEVGVTASGRFDIKNDHADLRGTVVPAYTLNSLLGRIPLVGDLFVGEKGSGVFAATYSVRGPLSGPELSVNPLAALTPGFLRGLFSIFEGSPAAPGMSGPMPDNAESADDTYE